MNDDLLPEDELLTLDRYGEVAAHIVHFKDEPCAEVVSRLGVQRSAWRHAESVWTAAIGGELSRQETRLTRELGASFAATKARLADAQPTLASIGLRLEDRVAVAAPPAPAPAEAIVAPPPVLAPPALSPVGDATVHAAPLPLMPAAVDYPPPPPVAVSLPAFIAPVKRRPSTGEMQAVPEPREALPFAGDAPVEASLASAKKHAEGVQGPKAAKKIVGASTEVDGRVGAIARSILPFGAGGAPSPARPSPPPKQTIAPVDPQRAPLAPGAPPMTVEQYASLCVELSMAPARAAEVAQRYSLSLAQKKAVDAHFEAAFRAQPALHAVWERACQAYRAWLLQQRAQK